MFSVVRIFGFLVLWTFPVAWSSMFNVSVDVCRDRVIECQKSLKLNTSVCGTDRITYSSYCQVVAKQCKGEWIAVDYLGPCIVNSPCFLARQKGPLVPTCNADGTFAAIQCHSSSNYCWCVTPSGNRLPETLIQHKPPRCPPSHPFPPIPSSSTSILLNPESSVSTLAPLKPQSSSLTLAPHLNSRGHCTQHNHLQFTKNLIKNFEIEYNRSQFPILAHINDIITWKFKHLDTNADGQLDQSEYEGLVKLAEAGVAPKKCARSWPRICDVSQDMRISLEEWCICLLYSTGDVFRRDTLERSGGPFIHTGESPAEEETSGSNNCPTKRLLAVRYQQKTAQKNLYVPECTKEGLYQPVQCYSGFCWCVHEETGVSIPKTGLKEGRPDCSGGLPEVRVMKGCERKIQDDLLATMMKMIVMVKRRNDDKRTPGGSEGETAATEMFRSLDFNKNGVLQRGTEWRSIRMMVPENRCAKKLPKFCDIDGDQTISLDEWLGCLNARSFKGDSPPAERRVNPIMMLQRK